MKLIFTKIKQRRILILHLTLKVLYIYSIYLLTNTLILNSDQWNKRYI